MRSLINPNIFEEHYIATAKELREMSRTDDFQSIVLADIQIDFSFNGWEYSIDIMPIVNGKGLLEKGSTIWFEKCRDARKFIKKEIAERCN